MGTVGPGGRGIEGEGGFEFLALTLLLTLHRSLRQARFRWIVAVLGIAIALLAVVPPDQALSQAQGSHDSSKDFDTLKAAGNENPHRHLVEQDHDVGRRCHGQYSDFRMTVWDAYNGRTSPGAVSVQSAPNSLPP